MNKKLLAIAVGAAMVAGATAATAGDEPTWYGKIHVSVDSMSGSGAADNDGMYVSSNSSRLGIKGKVMLDGGMNAVYKYEMSTDYVSSGLAGDRNAYAGINSGDHTIIAGRHDMPFKTVGRKTDLFGDTIGDNRSVTRLRDSHGDDWADRRSHVLMYKGKFDAVSVDVAYGSAQGVDDATDTGVGIRYKGGPLDIRAAMETHGEANAGGTEASSGTTIAGSYKMGNMKFLAGYSTITDAGGDSGDFGQVTGYMLGAAMKSGMNTFKIQYTAGETDVDDTDVSILSLGAFHAFSKKTSAYAVYSSISNGDAASESFGDTGHDGTIGAPDAGDSVSGFSVGMVHKF